MIEVSPIAKASMSVDLVADRVREIVVPDFRFIEMLGQTGVGPGPFSFELLLGTGGRRSEAAGMVVEDVDLAAKRVWVRQPVVEVEGRLVRNPTPKGGRARAVVVGPQLAHLLREHLRRRSQPAPDDPSTDQCERGRIPLERLSVSSPSTADLLHCCALGSGGAKAPHGSGSQSF